MKLVRPVRFLAVLLSVLGISSVLSVAVTTQNFSESYPVVVCSVAANPRWPGIADISFLQENSFSKTRKSHDKDSTSKGFAFTSKQRFSSHHI